MVVVLVVVVELLVVVVVVYNQRSRKAWLETATRPTWGLGSMVQAENHTERNYFTIPYTGSPELK